MKSAVQKAIPLAFVVFLSLSCATTAGKANDAEGQVADEHSDITKEERIKSFPYLDFRGTRL